MIIRVKAKELASLRIKQGLSRYALSRKAGLSKYTITRIEKGFNSPSPKTAKAILDVLGCDFEDIFTLLKEAGNAS
ncbi:MAG: helix-turn-helix transcriptional regulator [Bacillota bacterium]|nr:helix-turn-helix transcriptional regulator [Bacillota bacterium]